jgi:hypothetical protein
MRSFGDLPFPVGAAIIAGVTVAAIALAVVLNLGNFWPVAFVAPVAVAAWYLVGYSARPGPTALASPEPEPFEDPVEEADRLAQRGATGAAGPEEIEAPPGPSTTPTGGTPVSDPTDSDELL